MEKTRWYNFFKSKTYGTIYYIYFILSVIAIIFFS